VVINAGNKHKDMAHLSAQLENFKGDARFTYMEERSLVALQGKLWCFVAL
jgi:hypothetical protein